MEIETTLEPEKSNDDDVVIVAALRTPLTRASKGSLASVPAHQLLSTAVKGVLNYCDLKGTDVDDVCVGNVLLPAAGFAVLRMAMMAEAGIPSNRGGCFQMINRQCASSLQAISIIANSIVSNEITIGIGAGVESMSQNPMKSMSLPHCIDWESFQQSQDAMNCLLPMGVTSDTVIQKYGLLRHELDQFAMLSHKKAAAAVSAGKFKKEIVKCNDITQDDGIRHATDLLSLSKLKPAFTPTGSTTAGNSSQMTDGAAAVLLMKRKEAVRRNLPILAIWRGFAIAGVPPEIMGIGPAYAIPAVLQRYGLSVEDVDVFEINEAFASQALWCVRELRIDLKKVNPNGGAIALGHPLGATGARLVATLISELHRKRSTARQFGIISMCVGTGMGAAALIEVEPRSSL